MGNTSYNPCPEGGTMQPTRHFHSIVEIETNFKQYAEDNMLGLYGHRLQHSIERLYTLEQFHVCDLLVKLTSNNQLDESEALIMDIERIDLEQLDHLSLIDKLEVRTSKKLDYESGTYLGEEEGEGGLKLMHHRNMKSIVDCIDTILQCRKFVIFTTVNCFGSDDIFSPLTLPSKKSALQIFLEKVQTVNTLRHCSLMVVFIVNPNFELTFDQQLSRCLKLRELQSSRDTETSLFDFKFSKAIYKPVFPCLDQDRKIMLDGNHLQYDYTNGDLIRFLMTDPRLESYLDKYEFLQFANINNLAEEIAEQKSLSYLYAHPDISIVALAGEEIPEGLGSQCIRLKKGFIETELVVATKIKKNIYSLSESYYLRSSLFCHNQQNSHFHRLISARIKQLHEGDSIQFVRKVSCILYAPLTILYIKGPAPTSKESERVREISYSNYCKRKIGLIETIDDEIVEVCPQILFGSKQQLHNVVVKLSQLPKIGFPLVVKKQKISLSRRG